MQPELSALPVTRLDVVLWFLRVQMWLLVVALFTGLVMPLRFFGGLFMLQNIVTTGLPILILSVFPRLLASAMLGSRSREEISSMHELRSLVGRCVGAAFFVNSLGRAVINSFYLADALFSRGNFSLGRAYSLYLNPELLGALVAFLLGFALAFGPAIRDGFRAG